MTEKPDNQIYPAEWVALEGFLLNAGVSWRSKSEGRTPRLCLQDVQPDKPFKVKAVSFLIAFFFLISRQNHQPSWTTECVRTKPAARICQFRSLICHAYFCVNSSLSASCALVAYRNNSITLSHWPIFKKTNTKVIKQTAICGNGS